MGDNGRSKSLLDGQESVQDARHDADHETVVSDGEESDRPEKRRQVNAVFGKMFKNK